MRMSIRVSDMKVAELKGTTLWAILNGRIRRCETWKDNPPKWSHGPLWEILLTDRKALLCIRFGRMRLSSPTDLFFTKDDANKELFLRKLKDNE